MMLMIITSLFKDSWKVLKIVHLSRNHNLIECSVEIEVYCYNDRWNTRQNETKCPMLTEVTSNP